MENIVFIIGCITTTSILLLSLAFWRLRRTNSIQFESVGCTWILQQCDCCYSRLIGFPSKYIREEDRIEWPPHNRTLPSILERTIEVREYKSGKREIKISAVKDGRNDTEKSSVTLCFKNGHLHSARMNASYNLSKRKNVQNAALDFHMAIEMILIRETATTLRVVTFPTESGSRVPISVGTQREG